MNRPRLVVPTLALGAALVVCSASPAGGQDIDLEAQRRCLRELARKPGVWEPPTRDVDLQSGGEPADIRAFAARLPELVEPFRRLPFLQPPMGVDVTVQLYATGPGPDATGYWPARGFMSLALMRQFCLNGKPAVRPDGRKRRDDAAHLTIDVNDLRVGLRPAFTDSPSARRVPAAGGWVRAPARSRWARPALRG